MTDYSIRVATTDDEQSISELLQASYPKLMKAAYDSEVLSTALSVMTQANLNLLASGSFYIAEVGNTTAIGCGGWTPERPGDGHRSSGIGHIRHFATHPNYTGRGVGRAIYQRCEHQARAANIMTLECYSSLNAEPFYRALGFDTIDRIQAKLDLGQTLPVVYMRRALRRSDRRSYI